MYNLKDEHFETEKALEALANPTLVELPYPDCQPLDNLHRFKIKYMMHETEKNTTTDMNLVISRAKRSFARKMAPSKREYEHNPSKNIVAATAVSSNSTDENVKFIERGKYFIRELGKKIGAEGPLETLAKAVESESVVDIRIRSQSHQRSIISGKIKAYDRFMNLLVTTNVRETWQIVRKKNGKRSPPLSGTEVSRLSGNTITKIYNPSSKSVSLERTVGSAIFIAGNQIISISKK